MGAAGINKVKSTQLFLSWNLSAIHRHDWINLNSFYLLVMSLFIYVS